MDIIMQPTARVYSVLSNLPVLWESGFQIGDLTVSVREWRKLAFLSRRYARCELMRATFPWRRGGAVCLDSFGIFFKWKCCFSV
jgi:hypothetical protein